jgi:hypothetical protein
MTTYQLYDFIKDINFHIKNKSPINLDSKSNIFKSYLFELRIYNIDNKIKRNHPIFKEEYFLFVLYNVAYVAKKINNDPLKFDYVEILNGLKSIRKIKLKKIFE